MHRAEHLHGAISLKLEREKTFFWSSHDCKDVITKMYLYSLMEKHSIVCCSQSLRWIKQNANNPHKEEC